MYLSGAYFWLTGRGITYYLLQCSSRSVAVETFVCDNFLARLKLRDCENFKVLSTLKFEPQKSQKRGLLKKFQHKNGIFYFIFYFNLPLFRQKAIFLKNRPSIRHFLCWKILGKIKSCTVAGLRIMNNRTPDFGVWTARAPALCGLFDVYEWPHTHTCFNT